MDIKAEMAKVASRMDELKLELFQMENRKGHLVSELLKLQGQMELLRRLSEIPLAGDNTGSVLSKEGKDDAGQNP